MEKKKVSEAQKRATAKFEKNNYYKTLVRFPIDKEESIRKAACDSVNGFIVKCVLDQVENRTESKEESKKDNPALQSVIDQLQGLDEKKLALVLDFIRIIEKQ